MLVNLDAFNAAPLERDPFDHVVVPSFVPTASLREIHSDAPRINKGGSFPPSTLTFGPRFRSLLDDLMSDTVRDAFARKFEMDLSNRPATLTVRGQTRAKDGRIHIDSKTKLITVLVYLNEGWQSPGGKLRLLRNEHNLDDYIKEIEPANGNLVAFRCSPNAWHGHTPHVGERLSLQLNWVVSDAAAKSVERRHGVSALLKRIATRSKASEVKTG